jgi:ferric-dicitrate binding protein FerR (iron transport regulator)
LLGKNTHNQFNNVSQRCCKHLSEVYHKEFVLSDTTLYACTLTTQFEDEDIETVLRVLESTLDIIVTTDKDKYIISGNGCK